MNQAAQVRISIAMATYNGGRYLRDQLDSFAAQTRLPDELVITDDGSTDDTPAIIQEFAATAPFEVRWEQNEINLGYTGNFNKALLKTTGDLVFLSDQDDVWFPEKLERMERHALDDPEALVVMNDAALTDGELNDTGLTKLGQIASAGLTDSSFVMGCCTGVRRQLLDLCLPIPTAYRGHDGWIVKMAEGMERKRVYPEVLQWYRRHESNESQFVANRTRKVTRRTVLVQSISGLMTDDGCEERDQNTSSQAILFLDGVREAQSRASPPLSDELRRFSSQLEGTLKALDDRVRVRSKPRLQRLPGVVRCWRKGGYKEFAGLKSAIRDLVFR